MPRKRASSSSPHPDTTTTSTTSTTNPSSKRAKPTPNPSTSTTTAKPPSTRHLETLHDDQQNPYWSLNPSNTLRRLTLNTFKAKTMVNIREYYEPGGDKAALPGKKGISLTIEQFDALVAALPAIEKELAGMGEVIGRPEYGDFVEDVPGRQQDEEGEEEDGGGGSKDKNGAGAKTARAEKKDAKERRKAKENFEATSDEEEEEVE